MRVSAHQPIYLGGYLGHFAKLAWCDEWIVMDACPMEDSGFENRNRILSPVGEQMLTVPVHRGRGTPLSEIRTCGGPWARKHIRSIEFAYQHAPYWGLYEESLHWIFSQKWERLVDLNLALFKFCMDALGLARPIRLASTMGLVGTKSALVLDMAMKAGATEYLFGMKGRDYADVAAFERAGIKVRFQEYKHPTYPQIGPASSTFFQPNLSVLDLIMNVGPESLNVLTNHKS